MHNDFLFRFRKVISANGFQVGIFASADVEVSVDIRTESRDNEEAVNVLDRLRAVVEREIAEISAGR